MVWTGNLRTTVAGTLSVGGFGDTSSRHGAQIDNVESLKILSLDGVLHETRGGDPLFEYSLAGRGQLGIIVEASVRTVRRRSQWMGLHLRWDRIEHYVDDMKLMIEESAHDFFRAKADFGTDGIEAAVGDIVGGGTVGAGPWPKRACPLQVVDGDLYSGLLSRPESTAGIRFCVPALEFVLPLDAGVAIWTAIRQSLIDSNLVQYFDDAATSIGVIRGRSVHPLAPLPGTDFALGVPLRPSVPLRDVPSVLPVLRDAAARVLDGGGRIYMMSIDVHSPNFLARQFRGHYARFVELKTHYDPKGLLNPGLLDTVS
jgi:FAD/FMN-containing dehydrogenase